MTTLTILISDAAAAKLSAHAAENGKSPEEWAARALEEAYETDWLDDLTPEDRAAIAEGVAQADRGEFATDAEVEEVYSRFDR
jgi:predicted transcriptional regulator